MFSSQLTTPATTSKNARRSTRAARGTASAKRDSGRPSWGRPSSRGGGGGGSDDRTLGSGKARKWMQVMRPPAKEVGFSLPVWVPVSGLTQDEIDQHLPSETPKQAKTAIAPDISTNVPVPVVVTGPTSSASLNSTDVASTTTATITNEIDTGATAPPIAVAEPPVATLLKNTLLTPEQPLENPSAVTPPMSNLDEVAAAAPMESKATTADPSAPKAVEASSESVQIAPLNSTGATPLIVTEVAPIVKSERSPAPATLVAMDTAPTETELDLTASAAPPPNTEPSTSETTHQEPTSTAATTTTTPMMEPTGSTPVEMDNKKDGARMPTVNAAADLVMAAAIDAVPTAVTVAETTIIKNSNNNMASLDVEQDDDTEPAMKKFRFQSP